MSIMYNILNENRMQLVHSSQYYQRNTDGSKEQVVRECMDYTALAMHHEILAKKIEHVQYQGVDTYTFKLDVYVLNVDELAAVIKEARKMGARDAAMGKFYDF